MLSEEKKQEFIYLSDKLIKFLAENCHPHTCIVIHSTNAQLLESKICHFNEDYLCD